MTGKAKTREEKKAVAVIWDYADLRARHQNILDQLTEVVAAGLQTRLRRELPPSVLNELYVEVTVRDSARGNIKILAADHDLGTAALRETDLSAGAAA